MASLKKNAFFFHLNKRKDTNEEITTPLLHPPPLPGYPYPGKSFTSTLSECVIRIVEQP
jgi:hypothetical protein